MLQTDIIKNIFSFTKIRNKPVFLCRDTDEITFSDLIDQINLISINNNTKQNALITNIINICGFYIDKKYTSILKLKIFRKLKKIIIINADLKSIDNCYRSDKSIYLKDVEHIQDILIMLSYYKYCCKGEGTYHLEKICIPLTNL